MVSGICLRVQLCFNGGRMIVLRSSFLELLLLDEEPDNNVLATEGKVAVLIMFIILLLIELRLRQQ